jgi:hypothetical protein
MLRGPTLIPMCWWIGETGIGAGPSVALAIIGSRADSYVPFEH